MIIGKKRVPGGRVKLASQDVRWGYHTIGHGCLCGFGKLARIPPQITINWSADEKQYTWYCETCHRTYRESQIKSMKYYPVGDDEDLESNHNLRWIGENHMTSVTADMTVDRAINWVIFAMQYKQKAQQKAMKNYLLENFTEDQIKMIGDMMEWSPIVNLRKKKTPAKVVVFTCPGCHQDYEYLQISRPRKYCSDKCRMRVYRRRQKRQRVT